MFGLFKRKSYTPSVTQEDKDWVEKNLNWFIETFGIDEIIKEPFVLPTLENFPYQNLKDNLEFQKLFEQLCGYWDIDPDEIVVKFFDDIKSKQWSTWVLAGKFNEPGGVYYQEYSGDKKRFSIHLAKSGLDNPQLLISVISHELAHVKLLGGNYIKINDADMEQLTDLATIYFGFGLFIANSCMTRNTYWMGRLGYLPNEVISYSNALICYISGQEADNYSQYLNSNTQSLFLGDFEFLQKTQDTFLTKDKLQESKNRFAYFNLIDDGFKNKAFDKVIEVARKLIELDSKNISGYNNWGYALLQQKKYHEAIDIFTKAVDIDPYWEYSYNNRGYCKLQLGDFDNAFADIHSSCEMNSCNSYAWRNLGAYYFMTNDFSKAIEYFEKAQKMDPQTELIYFYLGQTYLKLGDQEKAKHHLDKSKEINEHNDSVIE